VLTPVEELGLSGMSLASRVRKAFYTMSEPTIAALIDRIRDESLRRHLVYMRDGEVETIRVLPCPITVLPDQLAYIHFVSLTIVNALKRLPELYIQDFAVREILRLSPDEEAWLWECWGPGLRENNPVFGRLDAVIDFTSPMWKNSLHFVEPNLSGVGGLHLIPTCEQLLADIVLPRPPGTRRPVAARGRPGHPRAPDAGDAGPSRGASTGRHAISASSSPSTAARGSTSRRHWPSSSTTGTA